MTCAAGEERLRADSRSPSGSAMITVPCAPTAMGAAQASGQRGGQASRDVGGLDEEKRRTRPRVGERQRGPGNAAERGHRRDSDFCELPAECAARILVRTLGLSSISLSGQSSWLAGPLEDFPDAVVGEHGLARRLVEVPCRACGLLAGVADGGSVRPCPWLSRSAISKSVSKDQLVSGAEASFHGTWKIAHKPRTTRHRGWVTRPFRHKSHKPRFLSARS